MPVFLDSLNANFEKDFEILLSSKREDSLAWYLSFPLVEQLVEVGTVPRHNHIRIELGAITVEFHFVICLSNFHWVYQDEVAPVFDLGRLSHATFLWSFCTLFIVLLDLNERVDFLHKNRAAVLNFGHQWNTWCIFWIRNIINHAIGSLTNKFFNTSNDNKETS